MAEKRSFFTDFDIYSTEKGAVCVTFEVQREILKAVSKRPRTESELIAIVGRSQPVVSIQLSKMIELGLITSERDPIDSRTKRFYLNAELLMESGVADVDSMHTYNRTMERASDNPEYAFRALLETMNMYFENSGVNVGPVVRQQGIGLAYVRLAKNRRETLEETVLVHSAYLDKAGLGKTCLMSTEPLVITYVNDLDVTKSVALSYSGFFQGYYAKVISDYFNREYDVVSVEVYGENNEMTKITFAPVK